MIQHEYAPDHTGEQCLVCGKDFRDQMHRESLSVWYLIFVVMGFVFPLILPYVLRWL